MERAKPLVRRAGALERHVLLNELQDVRLQAQIVKEALRK